MALKVCPKCNNNPHEPEVPGYLPDPRYWLRQYGLEDW